MAYRKNADRDEDKAKAYELEQVCTVCDMVNVYTSARGSGCHAAVNGKGACSHFDSHKCK